MAGPEAAPAETLIRRLLPNSQEELFALAAIADFHRRCLPKTASSRAGIAAVSALYRVVLHDPHGLVLWSEVGGFVAATTNLRATEKRIRVAMPLVLSFRLAAFHMLSPGHLISRALWDSQIPKSAAGYILTIGSVPSLKSGSRALPGSLLLNAAENIFSQLGLNDRMVDTELKNEPARKFYKKNGYEEIRKIFGQVLMRKIVQ